MAQSTQLQLPESSKVSLMLLPQKILDLIIREYYAGRVLELCASPTEVHFLDPDGPLLALELTCRHLRNTSLKIRNEFYSRHLLALKSFLVERLPILKEPQFSWVCTRIQSMEYAALEEALTSGNVCLEMVDMCPNLRFIHLLIPEKLIFNDDVRSLEIAVEAPAAELIKDRTFDRIVLQRLRECDAFKLAETLERKHGRDAMFRATYSLRLESEGSPPIYYATITKFVSIAHNQARILDQACSKPEETAYCLSYEDEPIIIPTENLDNIHNRFRGLGFDPGQNVQNERARAMALNLAAQEDISGWLHECLRPRYFNKDILYDEDKIKFVIKDEGDMNVQGRLSRLSKLRKMCSRAITRWNNAVSTT